MELINKLRTFWYVFKYQYMFRKGLFGHDTLIRCKLKISGQGKVVIGNNCRFEADPWGDDYVTIYTHRKHARINIGNNVNMRATRLGSHLSITIGNNVVIENASVYDSDFHNIDSTKRDDGFNEGDRMVVIGNESYVGCESLCSKGTILENRTIMLPMSFAGAKKFPPKALISGMPARQIKYQQIENSP